MSEKPASVTYLTTTDVARMCQVSQKTVYKWLDTGDLKYFKTPGGHRRFHRDEVLVFMRRTGFLRSWETLPEAKTQ